MLLKSGTLNICIKFKENIHAEVCLNKAALERIEIPLRHGCSSVNLLHNFRRPFPRNTSRELYLYLSKYSYSKISCKIKNKNIGSVSVVACFLIKKSENQTRVPGSTKEGHMTFVKSHETY